MDNGIAYLEETFGCQSIVHPWGFVCYKPDLSPMDCYIQAFYICPEYRSTGKGQELMNELITEAKKQGYLNIVTNTWLQIKNPQASIISQLKFGFIPYSAECGNIYFKLSLKGD